MFAPIQHILVPIRDPRQVPKFLLRKVGHIARLTRASVELYHAVGDSELEHFLGLDRVTIGDRIAKQLERHRNSPALRGVPVRTFVSFDRPGYLAVADRAELTRADLVIAAPRRRAFGSRLMLRNADWQLIRQCPCPLLLLRTGADYTRPVILAAVDPFHQRAKPAGLDEQLIGGAGYFAKLLTGSVHVFHAFMPATALLTVETGQPPGWISPEIEALHESQVAEAFADLGTQCNIKPSHMHLLMGDVRTQLKETARRLRARIVVMGAISRSHLKRLVIGSTAEHVLDALPTDVLILKPDQKHALHNSNAPPSERAA